MLCIGLFGTCGGSQWREKQFIPRYDKLGIAWYNPQVEDWDPSLAEVEAEHLANDAIILFPITSETYAFGSLAETGFSMLNAISLDDRREFLIYISQEIDDRDPEGDLLDDRFNEDGSPNPRSKAKDSLRTRALVKQHLKKLRLPNVYIVDSLEEMLDVSLKLWESVKIRYPLRELNPHRKAKKSPEPTEAGFAKWLRKEAATLRTMVATLGSDAVVEMLAEVSENGDWMSDTGVDQG